MDQIRVTYLNDAGGALVAPNLSVLQSHIVAFTVGDSFGFIPNATENTPRGNITFRGGREHIRTRVYNNDRDTQVTLVIPEDYNNVAIGNIVLYAFHEGAQRAAVSVVLPELVIKRDAIPDATRKQGYNYPGSRLEVTLRMEFREVSELPDTVVVVNVVQPTFNNLPFFGNLSEVPSPGANPHQQFVINRTDAHNHPALVVKGYDDAYWSSPLYQNLLSPKYGVINGFESERDLWVWGGTYDTRIVYDGAIGGLSYDEDASNLPVVGGGPY